MATIDQIENISMNVPSDHSTITDNTGRTINTDRLLTTEQKKHIYDEIFTSRSWQEEDKYEVQIVKQIVWNNIFKHVKSVKGEGAK